MKISVAMAVYNGERFLREQLESILGQLQADDELIISLDPSTDGSRSLIEGYASTDVRVKLFEGPGKGLMKNFENAIMQCNGDLIFMADQDDVWIDDKVEKCVRCFEQPDVMVVVHDATVYTQELQQIEQESFFEYKGCRRGFWKNVLKNSYMGCCMVFRKELLKWVMPFPKNIPMHDQWIGLMAELHGKTVFLQKQLLKYRRHDGNMTKMRHAGVFQMILWRIQIIWNIILRKLIV